ncbi:hypothetical protein Sgou_02570 [Streptomyces gougerotii]|uniref:Uncharacterized protein n=1 Tax=Streptomyces gougerotii TaxID=53448 RepID=A0ABQ1CZ60_9ACTN|nr:hypothetical protein Sgou_02570 [Streptomyces gougerotii]
MATAVRSVEAVDGPSRLEDGLHRAETLHVADPHVRAERGGAVAELEESGLGGAPLDVGGVGGDGAGGVGGEGEVAVGVRFGGGRQEQVAPQVDAGAGRGEAAGGTDGLDAAAAEADVDGAAVGEGGAGEQDVGAVEAAGGAGGRRGLRLAVGHRAPGARAAGGRVLSRGAAPVRPPRHGRGGAASRASIKITPCAAEPRPPPEHHRGGADKSYRRGLRRRAGAGGTRRDLRGRWPDGRRRGGRGRARGAPGGAGGAPKRIWALGGWACNVFLARPNSSVGRASPW